MTVSLRQLHVLILSVLFIWAGMAYAHHQEPRDDAQSTVTTSLSKAATPGKLQGQSQGHGFSHKACDECCHGGAHFETVCIDLATTLPIGREQPQSALTVSPYSHSLPPPTPPPQG